MKAFLLFCLMSITIQYEGWYEESGDNEDSEDNHSHQEHNHKQNCLKIDSGEFITPYEWNSGHFMTTGHGSRFVESKVIFKGDFKEVPSIITSLK